MDAAVCPYCQVVLAKTPQRKTKCKSCGQFIYVRGTPSDRTKRLMTQAQMEESESAWAMYGKEQMQLRDISIWGLDPAEYSEHLLAHDGNRGQAIVEALRSRALSGDKWAMHGIRINTTDDAEKLLAAQMWFEAELKDLLTAEQAGTIGGVRFEKKAPWHGGVSIRLLHSQGDDIATIADKTGFSVATVEGELLMQARLPPDRPQCNRLAGQMFSVSDARDSGALPCGPHCDCNWVAVSTWEIRRLSGRRSSPSRDPTPTPEPHPADIEQRLPPATAIEPALLWFERPSPPVAEPAPLWFERPPPASAVPEAPPLSWWRRLKAFLFKSG